MSSQCGVCTSKGPQGQKRPADIISCAIMVAEIASGELAEELQEPSGKVRSGKAGGRTRATKLTKEERSAIARKAAATGWICTTLVSYSE